MKELRPHSIRHQLQRMSLLVVVTTTLLGLGGTLLFTLYTEYRALDRNLLNSAQIIARATGVSEHLSSDQPQPHSTQFLSSAIREISDIDIIVAVDAAGIIRYSPDVQQLGQPFSDYGTLPIQPGKDFALSTSPGFPGMQRCAYAIVRDSIGTSTGFVAVGIRARSVEALMWPTVFCFALLALAAALVGSLLARRISTGITDSLMGYEPAAFRRLFHQREDILEALEEGIIAIDRESKIIYLNQASARMLGLPSRGDALGHPLKDVYPGSQLSRLLSTGRAEYNINIQCLPGVQAISDRMPIWEDGEVAGAVAIFRDRTEVTQLAEDLTGVRHMVDSMRAYTHEFMNKLHIILGLIQLGRTQDAEAYIMDITQTQRQAVSRVMDRVEDPSIAALLVGKTSRSAELGVHLTLDKKSSIGPTEHLVPSGALVTILGNLIENALESLNNCHQKEKEITICIQESPHRLMLCVEDTGLGIPPEVLPRIFTAGFSTKGLDRGTGLVLVKELVDLYHGQIRVETEPGVGTSFFLSFSAPKQNEMNRE